MKFCTQTDVILLLFMFMGINVVYSLCIVFSSQKHSYTDNHIMRFLIIHKMKCITFQFAAWLFEVSGSYTLPYIVLGGTSVLGGLAFLLIGPLSRKYPYVLHDPSVEEKTCEQFEEAQNVTDFTDAV